MTFQIWEQISLDVWFDGRKAGEVGSSIPIDPPLSNLRATVRVWKGITNSASRTLIGTASIPLEQAQVPCQLPNAHVIRYMKMIWDGIQ